MSPDQILNQVPNVRDSLQAKYIWESLPYMIPRHGDKMLGEAIEEAQMFGTSVIMPVKMVSDNNKGSQKLEIEFEDASGNKKTLVIKYK